MSETNSTIMDSMLRVGTMLHGGKYRIEQYLSSGGFGNTYIAIDTTFDNEKVVVKEFFIRGINEREDNSLSISVSNENNKNHFEEQKEKFWREAKRLRMLKHPNIVGVHDRFEENGTAYYVMDFIDGKSISEIIKRDKKPYTEQEALNIVTKVVEALGVVHQKQMFHMDIKPGNIMLDSQGEVKLIDFGASKQIVAGQNSAISVSTSGFCYTPGYAPSEQINQLGKNIGPWTDFYAVGGTLFNLLTMSPPPPMSDILEDEEDAFVLPEEISDHTRQLIVWMMRPQRAARPQSAAELLAALKGSEVPGFEKEPEVKPLPPKDPPPPKDNGEKKPQPSGSKDNSNNGKGKKSSSSTTTPLPTEETQGSSRKLLYGGVAVGVVLGLCAAGYSIFGNDDAPVVVADTVSVSTTDSLSIDSAKVDTPEVVTPAPVDTPKVEAVQNPRVSQPIQPKPNPKPKPQPKPNPNPNPNPHPKPKPQPKPSIIFE